MTQPPAPNERLERAIRHTPRYAFISLAPSGEIEGWNRGATELFGFSAEEAIGMDFRRLFIPEDQQRGTPDQELEGAASTGEASDRRWQQKKNGDRFYADGMTLVSRRPDGGIDGFVKIVRDASPEKRAEDRLRRLQVITDLAYSQKPTDELLNDLLSQFCEVFACDTAAVLLLDPDGQELTIRAGLGLEKDLAERFTVRVGNGFAGMIAARGEPLVWNRPSPDRFASKGLRERQLEAIMGVPLRVEGRTIGVCHVGTARAAVFDSEDVELLQLAADRMALALENARLFAAERRTADRAAFLSDAAEILASSLDYERTLSEVAKIAVPKLADWCAVDLTDADGTLRRLAVAHVDPEKVRLAHEMHERYPPRRDAPHGAYHVLATAEADLITEVTDEMLQQVARDQEHLAIARGLGLRSYMAVPLCTRQAPFGVLTFASAESGRRYNEEDLRFAQQIATRAALAIENSRLYRDANLAAHARDAFMAMLSHELRTSMTSILGWVSVLKSDGGDEQLLSSGLEAIEQSVRVQAHMIEDLLDISRTVAGKLHIERHEIDMVDVVEQTVKALQPQASDSGIPLETEVAATAETKIEGDARRLQQVLSNLITNALKFSEPGAPVRVRLDTTGKDVRLTVSDQGSGIPPSLLPHIFEPFRQAEGNERRKGGLGLGLAIVRTIVEMHGGSVQAESEGEGRGARFTVCLPRRAAATL